MRGEITAPLMFNQGYNCPFTIHACSPWYLRVKFWCYLMWDEGTSINKENCGTSFQGKYVHMIFMFPI